MQTGAPVRALPLARRVGMDLALSSGGERAEAKVCSPTPLVSALTTTLLSECDRREIPPDPRRTLAFFSLVVQALACPVAGQSLHHNAFFPTSSNCTPQATS